MDTQWVDVGAMLLAARSGMQVRLLVRGCATEQSCVWSSPACMCMCMCKGLRCIRMRGEGQQLLGMLVGPAYAGRRVCSVCSLCKRVIRRPLRHLGTGAHLDLHRQPALHMPPPTHTHTASHSAWSLTASLEAPPVRSLGGSHMADPPPYRLNPLPPELPTNRSNPA